MWNPKCAACCARRHWSSDLNKEWQIYTGPGKMCETATARTLCCCAEDVFSGIFYIVKAWAREVDLGATTLFCLNGKASKPPPRS